MDKKAAVGLEGSNMVVVAVTQAHGMKERVVMVADSMVAVADDTSVQTTRPKKNSSSLLDTLDTHSVDDIPDIVDHSGLVKGEDISCRWYVVSSIAQVLQDQSLGVVVKHVAVDRRECDPAFDAAAVLQLLLAPMLWK